MSKADRLGKAPELALSITAADRPGPLAGLARVIFEHGANVVYVGIGARHEGLADIYFELDQVADADALVAVIEALPDVEEVRREPTFHKIFGRRVVGAGAQASGVVMGAVNEADRHNIRGERISVDTIPLVGKKEIAEAVRAVARLPRVECLV